MVCAVCGLVGGKAASGQVADSGGPDLPQAPSPSSAAASESARQGSGSSISGLPKRILFDELHVVSSPSHLRKGDLVWLLPLAGASGAAFATDTHTMRDVVSRDSSFNANAGTASDALRDGFLGVPVALFGAGQLFHQEHAREAGVLGGEAIVDAYALGAVAKLITLRERPQVDHARGAFFQTSAGWDSSFPSGHSLVAWSSAAVLAGEYNRPWQQATVYLLAGGVSVTRVLAQQHFP